MLRNVSLIIITIEHAMTVMNPKSCLSIETLVSTNFHSMSYQIYLWRQSQSLCDMHISFLEICTSCHVLSFYTSLNFHRIWLKVGPNHNRKWHHWCPVVKPNTICLWTIAIRGLGVWNYRALLILVGLFLKCSFCGDTNVNGRYL